MRVLFCFDQGDIFYWWGSYIPHSSGVDLLQQLVLVQKIVVFKFAVGLVVANSDSVPMFMILEFIKEEQRIEARELV